MRSPLWAAVAPTVAAVAALGRWWSQGSGNWYTAVSKRFYVPDPDLGWRVVTDGPLWIGLEAIAACAAIALGVAAAALLVRRLERRRGVRWTAARALLWLGGAVPLALPIAAFATGAGPEGGRESLPAGATAAAPRAEDGIEGGLPLPAGRYEVVAHPGSAITASLSAGKEEFEARFARGIRGHWIGDPGDLRRPIEAQVEVDPSAVDTGIALRSQHAREEYLHAAKYPTIGLRITRVVAARQDGPTQLGFRAGAELDFLGEKLPVELTGTLRAPDAAARARLGLEASDAVVVADAALEVSVRGTGLRADTDSFDRDRIPIRVSLVFVRRGDTDLRTK